LPALDSVTRQMARAPRDQTDILTASSLPDRARRGGPEAARYPASCRGVLAADCWHKPCCNSSLRRRVRMHGGRSH